MQTIVFNGTKYPTLGKEDSRTVRIAYLLSQKVALAGTFYLQLYRRGLDIKISDTMPLKNKIEIIEKYVEAFDHSLIEQTSHLKTTLKQLAQIKYKTPQQIAVYQQFIGQVSGMYKQVSGWYDRFHWKSGYFELSKLIDEQIVETFSDSHDEKEKEEITRSRILSLDFGSLAEPKLFFLSNQFFDPAFVDKFSYVTNSHADADADRDDCVYLEPLLQIPNINYLNAAELILIRNGLNNCRNIFCEETDHWIKACYANKNFEERKQLLHTKVLPAAKQLSEDINNNPNIKHLTTLNETDNALAIYIGEIPFQLLLDYYSYYKIIDADILAELKTMQAKEERFNQKWPFLTFKVLNDTDENNAVHDEMMIAASKKSIDIN